MEKQDRREALDVAALAGDILLASGAEIFRVEETIFRIARAYGVESSDAFVLSSGIFLTAGSEREQDFARVRHIPLSAVRLDRVTAVNQLSREIVEGKHTPAQARERLIQIQKMPQKAIRFLPPEWAVPVSAFCSAEIRWTVWRRLRRGLFCICIFCIWRVGGFPKSRQISPAARW